MSFRLGWYTSVSLEMVLTFRLLHTLWMMHHHSPIFAVAFLMGAGFYRVHYWFTTKKILILGTIDDGNFWTKYGDANRYEIKSLLRMWNKLTFFRSWSKIHGQMQISLLRSGISYMYHANWCWNAVEYFFFQEGALSFTPLLILYSYSLRPIGGI